MRKKQLCISILVALFILPSFLVKAAPPSSSAAPSAETTDGILSYKDEVVYANLQATGQLDEIYVVNILEVAKAGSIIDFGHYNQLINLTDLSEIKQNGDEIKIKAPKGKFYYQGNQNTNNLPWDIAISYFFNGQEISPRDLPGKDGKMTIEIATSANEKVDPVFFDHYLLQISLSLDPEHFTNIEVSDGMVANAGKNKQITYTVMPEQDGELQIKADVVDFELQGIEIAAVPSSMSIDAPDIDEMTKDMKTLSQAIKELDEGVGKLKNGVGELNDGVNTLQNGSQQYKQGINDINVASNELIDASASIHSALSTISSSLNEDSGEFKLGNLNQLPDGLFQLANGLHEIADGLLLLKENYSIAYHTLAEAIDAIPNGNLTEEQIHSLYTSGADPELLDQLIATYSAALTAKGTFAAVSEGFGAVETTMELSSHAIKEMAGALEDISSQFSNSIKEMDMVHSITQLQEGLATLSANYGEFHAGLTSYTKGVGQLANSYGELHSGIVELSKGTREFETGVAELRDGTKELYEATSDLPDQMQEEIDQVIADYDKSDFKSVSFVSPHNENINSVQFVIKTESIKKEKEETTNEPVEEEKGFWARLLALFSR